MIQSHCKSCGQPIPWVDGKVAAARIGVNESRVRQLIDDGRFPNAMKVARAWRIPIADLEAFMEARG